MHKITCEICGTIYSDSEPSCPVCGWEQDGIDFGDELAAIDEQAKAEETAAPPQPQKQKEIFDYDAVNQSDYEAGDTEQIEDAELTEEDSSGQSNPVLVAFLTILIVVLLGTIGFIFMRYFLPAQNRTQETEPTQAVQTEETETTILTISCTGISLASSIPELTQEGQYWLMHVVIMPEDTTDTLLYTSADESVATVNEEGRITAISEGSTTIVVTCGSQRLECPVTICYATEATEEETTAPVETTAEVTKIEEASAVEVTEEAPTEESASTLADITLKLKKVDITFGRSGVYVDLELDCDLSADDVQWATGNPNVATVQGGRVTAVGPGITNITATYGNQTVTCVVRCSF